MRSAVHMRAFAVSLGALVIASGCDTVVAARDGADAGSLGNAGGGLDAIASDADAAAIDAPRASDAKDRGSRMCVFGQARPTPRGEMTVIALGEGRLISLFGDDGVPVQCNPAPHATTDAWYFDACDGWTALDTKNLPPPRARPAFARDTKGGRAWIFGGRYRSKASGPYVVRDDLWQYDVAAGTWSPLSAPVRPPARFSPALAHDAKRDRLLLFGGGTSTSGLTFGVIGDLWSFDLALGVWTKLEPSGSKPTARLFHVGAIDRDHRFFTIFTGGDDNAFVGPFLSDAWSLDLETDTWKKHPSTGARPMSRIKSGLVAVPSDPRLLLFGGHDDGSLGNTNDLWWLDPETGVFTPARSGDALNKLPNGFCDFPPDFTEVDKESPERREAFGIDIDPITGRVIVFGGKSDCGALVDVWELDPATESWKALSDDNAGWSCVRFKSPCGTLCI